VSALVDFVLPAVFVSVLALGCLRVAERAPAAVKLSIASTGLLAWVVPWPLIRAPAGSVDFGSVERWIQDGEQLATLKGGIVSTIESLVPAVSQLSFLWLAIFVPGLILLTADLVRYLRTIMRWERESQSGDHLRDLLDPLPGLRRLRIRIVSDSTDAVAAGLLRPTVYIGEGLVRSDDLRVVLTHEAHHIRRHDPVWLMLIWSIARFYCFNPIVVALERHAVLAIEAACDEACARMLGRREYRLGLARLVLGRAERRFLPAPGLYSSKLDLIRLGWLASGPQMDLRAWVAVLAAGTAFFGGVALAAATSPDPRTGDWIEIADASRYGYDISPALLRFERLPDGLTRLYPNITSDGGATWFDYRCDGREYGGSDASGLTLSCVAVDRWTNEYRIQRGDGSGTVTRTVETISRDGQSLQRVASGGTAGKTGSTFARVQ
jgi:Zn-dependent protease with chaperone function